MDKVYDPKTENIRSFCRKYAICSSIKSLDFETIFRCPKIEYFTPMIVKFQIFYLKIGITEDRLL